MKNVKEIIKNTNKTYSNNNSIAVTTCIGYIHEQFDSNGVAQALFEKNYNNENSKYYQMTKDDILNEWENKSKTSCKYGSLLDSYIELFLTKTKKEIELWKLDNNFDNDERLKGICLGFEQFYNNLLLKTDYKYISREEKMYIISDNGNILNGRFDCLFYSESLDRYLIIDWKTTDTISKDNKFKKMFGPLYDKDDCNANEYTIQLQMYKKALSETYKITIPENIDIYICQLCIKPNQFGNNYILHKQNFEYNSNLLNQIIDFGTKKHNILNKSEA